MTIHQDEIHQGRAAYRRTAVDTSGRTGADARATTRSSTTVIRGRPGKSAYEIAVEHGYPGTEAEWVASMSLVVEVRESEPWPPETELPNVLYVRTVD